jgi:tetratricopeptide (TPR) repeat protein
LEKIPLFLLSVASVYISTFSLHQYGDLVPLGSVDIELRVSNALVSYIAYLGKMVAPMNLTCFYPFPVAVPLWKSIGALILLVGITAIAVRMLRNYPFFLIGWLWYLGTLLPVIGLIQAGLWPALADRFAYIPFIGIYAVIAWGGAKIFETSKRSAIWLKFAAVVVLLVLLMLSHHQVRYWKNSVALFQHAIAVTKDNYLSYYAIGYAYEQQGNFEEAIRNYRSSLKINPDQIDVNYNLARLLASEGNIYDAIRHYQRVLQTDPKDSQAHNNLGNVYFRQGDLNKAIGHYLEAIHINPGYAKAHNNLGAALIRKGMITAAIDQFRTALRIQPDDEQTRRLLEVAIAKLENRKKTSNSITEH